MRKLLYVPIVHSEADLGSAGTTLAQKSAALSGDRRWVMRKETVDKFWETVAAYIRSFDPHQLRVYQDRLAQISGEQDRLGKLAEAYRLVIADLEEHEEELATASSPGQKVDDAIYAVLEAEGKPLHRKDIYDRLTQRGIKVAGQKPVSNVGAHLSLDRRFKSVGGGKWGLNKWDEERKETEGQAEADLDRHMDEVRSILVGR